MLPEVVWNMPHMGTINVHASLLPQYRGAAPINWAIINGETETGVTTFKLQHAIDTGNILLQQKLPILLTDNAGTLDDKLMDAGAALIVKTVRGLADGTLAEIPQNDMAPAGIKHAPKIFTEHRQIDWTKPVADIHNFIRGLAPYPAAFTHLGDKTIKIYKSHYKIEGHNEKPGSYQVISSLPGKPFDTLRMAATDGWLYIDELQQEGKKRLDTESFLRGFRN
jgi:methionyl-tRNA formyltransferase